MKKTLTAIGVTGALLSLVLVLGWQSFFPGEPGLGWDDSQVEEESPAEVGVEEPSLPGAEILRAPVVTQSPSRKVSSNVQERLGAESVEIASREESAKDLASHLGGIPTEEALGFLSSLASDPEISGELERVAQELLGSADASLRARGLLLLVGLGRTSPQEWIAAFLGEADEDARVLLVQNAPLQNGRTVDHAIVALLLERAASDPSQAVRVASIESLPGGLSEGETGQLVDILVGGDSTEASLAAIGYFTGARLADKRVAQGLLDVATEPASQKEVRRKAAVALLSSDQETPGLLASIGSSAEAVHRILGETGRRKSG